MSDSHAWVIKNVTTGKYYDTQRLRWSDEIGIPHAEPPYQYAEALILEYILSKSDDSIEIKLVEWDDEIDYWVEKRKRTFSMPLLQHVPTELRSTIRKLAEPYAPDWSQAPDGAIYYTVDSYNAVGQWHRNKPVTISGNWSLGFKALRPYDGECLPLGLDSRVLLWARKGEG